MKSDRQIKLARRVATHRTHNDLADVREKSHQASGEHSLGDLREQLREWREAQGARMSNKKTSG